MTLRSTGLSLLLALGSLFATAWVHGGEQGSSLSYQGRLMYSGAPANGTFDFQFTLWDAATNGVLMAGPISKSALPVANGQFSTALDFGAAAFDGGARWLEIAVRPSGNSDPHSVLTPRQQAGALPYALHALDSSRPSDLNALSNNFAALLAASNAALVSQINTLSNALRASISPGVTVASINPADAALLGKGLMNAFSIPAPAWANGTGVNQPAGRTEHSAIWTGSELMVWGGKASSTSLLASGGRYRPDLDQWTPVSTIAAPPARSGHSAIWTGDEMIVWGGFGITGFLAAGGRFRPALQQWLPVSAAGPSERLGHVAAWNGSRMIIWGGRNANGLLNDGGLYSSTNDHWAALAAANPPEARHGAAAIWTGAHLLVWGGVGVSGPLNTGAKLQFNEAGEPVAWQPISALNAPSPRSGHTAVWTGSRWIVWGGANYSAALGDGAVYDPITDTWTPLPVENSPSARTGHMAVWTGSEMVIWGGLGASGSLGSGAAYDPAANTWRTLQNPGSPIARDRGSAVWTGSECLVFGGLSNGAPLSALQRLNPQPTWFLYRKL